MKVNIFFQIFLITFFKVFVPQQAYLQSDPLSIIDASIKYHDPQENWSKFKANLHFNSIVERNGKIDTSDRYVKMDIRKNRFEMNFEVNSRPAHLIMNDKNCEGKFLDKKENHKEELFMAGLTCDRAKMYNSYYRYLLGMPMKLKDPGTIIDGEVKQKTYKDKKYDVIKVTYDPEVGSYTWLFYFDRDTRELILMEFSKDGSFQNGETIELNNKIRYQDMLLPGQLLWLVLPERNFLAQENIKYNINLK